MHKYLHKYIHTSIHPYICTYIHTYICTYIHTYVHIHIFIHTYIHTHTYTYTHSYTYIHMLISAIVLITLKFSSFISHISYSLRYIAQSTQRLTHGGEPPGLAGKKNVFLIILSQGKSIWNMVIIIVTTR